MTEIYNILLAFLGIFIVCVIAKLIVLFAMYRKRPDVIEKSRDDRFKKQIRRLSKNDNNVLVVSDYFLLYGFKESDDEKATFHQSDINGTVESFNTYFVQQHIYKQTGLPDIIFNEEFQKHFTNEYDFRKAFYFERVRHQLKYLAIKMKCDVSEIKFIIYRDGRKLFE